MKQKYYAALTSLFMLCTHTHLFAQENTASNEGSKNLFDLIMAGGWAMIPLGLTFFTMLFLVFYCFTETAKKKFIPEPIMPKLTQDLKIRDIESASQILAATPTVLSRTLGTALNKARPEWEDANKEKIEASFIDSMEAEDSSLGSWINYLNVVASVAPMIGLLGTVSGMIGAFQTIGLQGMGDPSALAGDIGQALITTATGLCIGIPSMIFYFYFKNRLTARMVTTAQSASHLIDHLAGEYPNTEYGNAVYAET